MVLASILLFVSGAQALCSKTHLFITMPLKMEALSGSCLKIPCSFGVKSGEDFSTTRVTFGVWLKNNIQFKRYPKNVVFNSSRTDNPYPMSIIGNLAQKNCTTLFYNITMGNTNNYFFRIENWPFRATAICQSLQINVNDSLSPTIDVSGNLREKESVTVTCSAFTPCPHFPPKLTWNLQKDPHSKIEKNADQSFTTKIQATITLSDKEDGSKITCSATYPVNEGRHVKTAEKKMTLSVSYAPKDTSASISPSASVSAGSWVNLTCSSRAMPPVSRFTWFKQSTDGPMNVSEGDFYSFKATYGGVYYCVATNGVGYQNSLKIHLSIGGESLQWGAVLGGIVGVIVLICLIVFLWHLKSARPSSQQNPTGEDLVVEESDSKTEEGSIHYGEIYFTKLKPEASSNSLPDSFHQENTVYAQVKVSKRVNSPTAGSSEELQ